VGELVYADLRGEPWPPTTRFGDRGLDLAHLNSPPLGARPAPESLAQLAAEDRPVQVLVSDGLSAEAVHHNVRELLPVLLDGLAARGVGVGTPILARYGRGKLAEPLAERLGADVVVYLTASGRGVSRSHRLLIQLSRRVGRCDRP
jgi:ethanolamine ammonia-lyase small subunit